MPTVPEWFYHDEKNLYDAFGNVFDASAIAFRAGPGEVNPVWKKVTARESVLWLRRSKERIRPPIGVIGPREASGLERERAYRIGRELAAAGLTVLCGGRQGVMEEVCRGVDEEGGVSVGLLPGRDWKCGNRYVGVPLPTGIGIARNALIACCAHVVVAVGTGLGTISEMALALQFEKRVFALADSCAVPGVETFASWEAMEPHFYPAVLNWHAEDGAASRGRKPGPERYNTL